MTPSIRVGFFEHFNGADTLLIDLTPDGLPRLIEWFRGVAMVGGVARPQRAFRCVCAAGLFVGAGSSRENVGLQRNADGEFVWLAE